jgi:nucleotide-binding universal stress UspA family protein
VLIDESRGQSLLVVGHRGHGGFTEMLTGSVAIHCVSHAACPVVVVRGTSD